MISVVIPIYKVEKYIANCIKSIIRQKYRNFEVIIVDDGTPDNSAKIAEELLFRERSIPYLIIHTVNRGVAAARNTGIINSHGEYIIMVDADDVLSPSFLANYNSMIIANKKINIYSSGFSVVKESASTSFSLNDADNPILLKASEAQIKFYNRQIKFLLPTFLIRKSFLDAHKIIFDEDVFYSEDVQFIWRCLAYNSKQIMHSPGKNYNYIFHAGSTMTASGLKKINTGFLGILRTNTEIKEMLTETVKCNFVSFSFFSLLHGASKMISYSDFKKLYKMYSIRYHLRKLTKLKTKKIKLVSYIFLFSKYLGYMVMKKC